MPYIGAERKSISRLSCCGTISSSLFHHRRQKLTLYSGRELRSQALLYELWPLPELSEGQKVNFFFSSFTWITGCRQPSTVLGGFFMESFPGSKVHCPFLALPSACIPTCFKWATQPKIGVAEKLPDINEVFSLSCLERSKCEGSPLFSWDQVCLVGLQGYLRSENQQKSECSKDQRSDLSYSLWHSNNITIKKWRVFSLQPTNF